jgi:hypothetical protein
MRLGENDMPPNTQGLTDQDVMVWEKNAAITASETITAQVIPIGESNRGMPVSPARHWQATVVRSITDLLRLPENWNSYGSQSVRYDTAMFAIVILENIMASGTPIPSVVPTALGGIQFEWHENDIDFEIDVIEPYHCEYAYHDEQNPAGSHYGELENNLLPLQEPIAVLTQRAEHEMFTLRRARVAS